MDNIRFKVDGITEEELSMLLEHDKEINNNLINKKDIYIYNNITSTSINTTSSYNNNYLSNKYYSSILYILIKKGFTYYSEIKKVLGVTNNFHLPKLERDDIVFSRDCNKEEINLLLTIYPNMPKSKINNMKIYEFNTKAKEFFIQPVNYDLIKRFSNPKIDDFLILQKNEFEKKLREQKEKEAQEEREYQVRLKNMGIVIESSKPTYEDYLKDEIEEW